MIRTVITVAGILFLFAACTQVNSAKDEQHDAANKDKSGKNICGRNLPKRSDSSCSQFIPIDSANKMLTSYLSSINSPTNDSDLHSIIFNADSLRKLLSNPDIANVKIMFAHTLDYINAGGAGINCGYQSNELTVIFAGYDNKGNYIFTPVNRVLEMGLPCPTNCPSTGSAAENLLPSNTGGGRK